MNTKIFSSSKSILLNNYYLSKKIWHLKLGGLKIFIPTPVLVQTTHTDGCPDQHTPVCRQREVVCFCMVVVTGLFVLVRVCEVGEPSCHSTHMWRTEDNLVLALPLLCVLRVELRLLDLVASTYLLSQCAGLVFICFYFFFFKVALAGLKLRDLPDSTSWVKGLMAPVTTLICYLPVYCLLTAYLFTLR